MVISSNSPVWKAVKLLPFPAMPTPVPEKLGGGGAHVKEPARGTPPIAIRYQWFRQKTRWLFMSMETFDCFLNIYHTLIATCFDSIKQDSGGSRRENNLNETYWAVLEMIPWTYTGQLSRDALGSPSSPSLSAQTQTCGRTGLVPPPAGLSPDRDTAFVLARKSTTWLQRLREQFFKSDFYFHTCTEINFIWALTIYTLKYSPHHLNVKKSPMSLGVEWGKGCAGTESRVLRHFGWLRERARESCSSRNVECVSQLCGSPTITKPPVGLLQYDDPASVLDTKYYGMKQNKLRIGFSPVKWWLSFTRTPTTWVTENRVGASNRKARDAGQWLGKRTRACPKHQTDV